MGKLVRLSDEQLLAVLARHDKFLRGSRGGECADLKFCDLRRVRLPRAKLERARMEGARLSNARFPFADFVDADLFAANLYRCDLSGAVLTRANLRGANLTEAKLVGADLGEADMRPGKLFDSEFESVKPTELDHADMTEANLTGALLNQSVMNGASLARATLDDSDLGGTVLTGADLTGARLQRAKLKDADMKGALLGNTDLSGANLMRADLRGVDLSSTNLKGANLSEANAFLGMLDLPGRIQELMRGHYIWLTTNGEKGECASFANFDLTDVDFSNADLTMADFVHHMLGDPDIRVIALLVEGIRDGPRFLRTARAAARAGKPMVAMKVGKSDYGIAATRSHTAALAGSAAVTSALFRQHGIVEVDDLDGYCAALNAKKYRHARPGILEQSWGMREMPINDPVGNKIIFCCDA